MRRLNSNDLELILICPDCSGSLGSVGNELSCSCCQSNYPYFRDRPVLMKSDNELFPKSSYKNDKVSNVQNRKNSLIIKLIKKLIPARSINIPRERMFHLLSEEYCKSGRVILVVGCGNQGPQLERYFKKCDTVFVFCDVDKNADADVFCDSHELPFNNKIFDGVITTAVLEHVMYPEKVVAEINRVLKDNGFIYTEIPFLQSVHEGAYDFTRFTMTGHIRLLGNFSVIESGMVAGPGTALVWSIDDFFKSLTFNHKISKLLSVISRILFFWLKYFDYLIKNNPSALNSASCTYFYGVKVEQKISPLKIIQMYKGSKFEHI